MTRYSSGFLFLLYLSIIPLFHEKEFYYHQRRSSAAYFGMGVFLD